MRKDPARELIQFGEERTAAEPGGEGLRSGQRGKRRVRDQGGLRGAQEQPQIGGLLAKAPGDFNGASHQQQDRLCL